MFLKVTIDFVNFFLIVFSVSEESGLWHSEPRSISELGVWEEGSPEPDRGAVMVGDKKRKRDVDVKKA